MDVVGPLERSKSENRYVLVICSYAIRYPESFSLRDMKAGQVAHALVQLFLREGVPRKILADKGTNILTRFINC